LLSFRGFGLFSERCAGLGLLWSVQKSLFFRFTGAYLMPLFGRSPSRVSGVLKLLI